MKRWKTVIIAVALIGAPGLSRAAMRSPLYPGKLSDTSLAVVSSIVATDFNGDGIEDLVVSGFLGTDILFGNGDGTFQPAIRISKPTAQMATLADFTGDGHEDMAIAGHQLLFMRGDGDGNFAPGKVIASTSYPDVERCDFNNDGNEDLATSAFGGFQIFLGNGDGSFTKSTTVRAMSGASYQLIATDLNDDGNCDIALTYDGDDSMYVFLGKGDATFSPAVGYAAGQFPTGISAGDFNGDGYPDLVVQNLDTYDISLYINNGDGTFQPQQRYLIGNTPEGGYFADINHDGYDDFVETIYNSGGPEVFDGNAGGILGLPTLGYLGPQVSGPVLADLNGDGNDDLVAATAYGWIVSYLGNGASTFRPDGFVATGLFLPNAITYADFNGDGHTDIAELGPAVDGIHDLAVSLGNGDGTFQPAASLQTWTSAHVTDMKIGDVNGDGNQDIVTTEYTNAPQQAMVVTYLGNGDGTFQSPRAYPAGVADTQLLLSDLNNDGHPDAIVHDVESPTTASIGVLINNGDGTFSPPVIYGPPNPKFLGVDDLDGDGTPDLAVLGTGQSGPYLSIRKGNGDGTFAAATTYLLSAAGVIVPAGIAIRDLNKDGSPDIVISDTVGAIYTLQGNGDGTFQSPVKHTLDGESQPSGIDFADEDQDGNTDIIAKDSDSIDILFGDGSGNFPRQAKYSAGAGLGFAMFDANGDGLPDLVTMAHDPDANAFDQGFYISLHLPPVLAFTGTDYSVTGGEKLTSRLVAVDPLSHPLSYSALTQPRHGTLTMQTDGGFTYAPTPGFSGVDSFRIEAMNGSTKADSIALIEVAKPSEPKISGLAETIDIVGGQLVTPSGFALTGTGPLTLAATSSNTALIPASAITWNADCTSTHTCDLRLLPTTGMSGQATVTLTVSDDYGQSTSQSIIVYVAAASSGGTGGSGGSGSNGNSGGGSSSGGGFSGLFLLFALIALNVLVCIGKRRNRHQGGKCPACKPT